MLTQRRGFLSRLAGLFASAGMLPAGLFGRRQATPIRTIEPEDLERRRPLHRFDGSRYVRCRMKDLRRGDLILVDHGDERSEENRGIHRVHGDPFLSDRAQWPGMLEINVSRVTEQMPAESMIVDR